MVSLASKRRRIDHLKRAKALKFRTVEGCHRVAQGNARGGNLEIVRPYHQTPRLKIGPEPGVMARYAEVKRYHLNRGQNPFDVTLSGGSSSGILGAFHSMEKLGSGDCSDDRLGGGELGEESPHLKFARSSAMRIEVSRISPMRA